jgi:hypothetical protein
MLAAKQAARDKHSGNVALKVAAYGDVPIKKEQALENTLAQQVVSKL